MTMQANSSVLLPRRRFIQTAASVAGFAILPVAYSAQVFAAEQRVIAGPRWLILPQLSSPNRCIALFRRGVFLRLKIRE